MTVACAAPTGAARDVSPKPRAVPSTPATMPNASPTRTPRPSPLLTGARLVRASVARSIDASGRPTGETTTFERATDSKIVLAIEVDAATVTTTLGYRRYFAGSFIDAKSSHPTHAGPGVVTFTWQKSPGAMFPVGSYDVHVLVDGQDLKTVNFAVR
jgi:hypothetical protein